MIDFDDDERLDGDAEHTVVSLLPGFRLAHRGRAVAPTPGAQRLVALLALHARPLPRSQIAGLLWPESTEARALACLRTSLRQLRQVHATLVVGDGRGPIALTAAADVDWTRAVAVAETILRGSSDVPGRDALELLRYPLLESWSEDWLDAEQQAFAELRAQALEQLSRSLARRGRFARAVQTAMIAVAAEPLRESAYDALIRAHLGEGNRAEALRVFRRLEQILRSELGLRPSLTLRTIVGPM